MQRHLENLPTDSIASHHSQIHADLPLYTSWFQTFFKTLQSFINLWARLSGGIHFITPSEAHILIYEVFILYDWGKESYKFLWMNPILLAVAYIKETIFDIETKAIFYLLQKD